MCAWVRGCVKYTSIMIIILFIQNVLQILLASYMTRRVHEGGELTFPARTFWKICTNMFHRWLHHKFILRCRTAILKWQDVENVHRLKPLVKFSVWSFEGIFFFCIVRENLQNLLMIFKLYISWASLAQKIYITNTIQKLSNHIFLFI